VQGRGARDYRGSLAGLKNVEIAFLSAADIVAQLAAGTVHMGVTGEDLVRETIADADRKVALLTPLGFGGANVVVAVPRAWIDVKTMADLEDVAASFRARRGERMRVATKYVNLTRRFFAKMHVSDYRIVESSGATEGAPAAGQAELIVDITTTGATLAANALKILDDGVILRSQANLVASLKADWSPGARENARAILSRIAAEEEARTTREVSTVLANAAPSLVADAQTLFSARLRFRADDGRLTLNCPDDKVAPLADWLIAQGADHVGVAALDYMFSAVNPLYEKLVARLAQDPAK
jgi:ATP phosphoribosyltransferase